MSTAHSKSLRSRSDALLFLRRKARNSLLHTRARDDPEVLDSDRLPEPRARATRSFSATRRARLRALLTPNLGQASWQRLQLRLEGFTSSPIHPRSGSNGCPAPPAHDGARFRSQLSPHSSSIAGCSTPKCHCIRLQQTPPEKQMTTCDTRSLDNMKLSRFKMNRGPPVPPGEPTGLNKERPGHSTEASTDAGSES